MSIETPSVFELEQKVPSDAVWHPFTGWQPNWIYRLKPVTVHKWKWYTELTDYHYTEEEALKQGFLAKVEGSHITEER